jgi:hypothetical protein
MFQRHRSAHPRPRVPVDDADRQVCVVPTADPPDQRGLMLSLIKPMYEVTDVTRQLAVAVLQ